MKKIAFIAIWMTLCMNMSAQVRFFAETSLNFTSISPSQRTFSNEITSEKPGYKKIQFNNYYANYQSSTGGNILFGAQYHITPQISLESGIDASLVNFDQTLESTANSIYYSLTDPKGIIKTDIAPVQKSTGAFNLFYLNVPISAFYHLMEEKLAVGVGIIPGFLINVKGGNKSEEREFNKGSFGMQIQLRYQFVDKFWITGAFQDYNTKFYNVSLKQSFSSNRLLKFGLRYDF